MNARATADVSVPTPIELDAPYGKFYVNRDDGRDHAGMRAKQLREVLILMSDADKSHLMLRLAKQLGGEVADRTMLAIEDRTNIEGLVAASIFARELSDFLHLFEVDGEADITLWMAQQLCDELGGTLRGMTQDRGGIDQAVAGADRRGWIKVLPGAKPDSNRDVLAWDHVDQMPLPAFYAEEEECWFSKYDGCKIKAGVVTHWRELEAPEGVVI